MNSRVYPRRDFSMAIQNASSWLSRQPNEIEDGRNLRFNEEIGAMVRRNGYVAAGDAFSASGKDPVGFHTAYFTTGARQLVAVPAEDNSATLVKVQESNGSWTTIINNLPVDVDVYFTDYRDEVFVSGYTTADDKPFQPRNIDKDLNVSLTRNLLFAPWAKYYVPYRGLLYATNVSISTDRYPDRFYKSSAPTGAITFVRGDQDNTYVTSTLLNQVPTMTDYTVPAGVVAASSEVNTDNRAWRAFDRDSGNTRWLANTTTGWIRYDFGAGNAKVIRYYAITGQNDTATYRNPLSWTLDGSNDASSWTTLHSVASTPAFSQNETRTFQTTNTTAYRYYRINITAPQAGTDYVGMKALALYATLSSSQPIQLNIDTARYVKSGMALDVYSPRGVFKRTLIVDSVDKVNNNIQFMPESWTISSVNATTDTITISDTTKLALGTQVRFNSSNTLPAGISPNVTYYSIPQSATTFKVAASYADALIGQAIDITGSGTGTHNVVLGYAFDNNDELWLSGRYGKLTTFWNTDYPTPDKADWSAVQPGADSSIKIVGAIESASRLFIFTENSTTRFDGTNPMLISKNIGCASMRSIKPLDDDWIVWLTPRGRVYARNEAGGQQEYISRGMYNKFFSKLSITQMRKAAAGITDGEYSVYVGLVDGEPSRAVYDFGSNTWSVDQLSHPTLMYANSVSDGVIKPFFASDDGRVYQDDTGDLDGDKVILYKAVLGKTNYGSVNDKYFIGHNIYSQNAVGLKILISIDDNDPITVGEIMSDSGDIIYPTNGDREKFKGNTTNVIIQGTLAGPPQVIYTVDDYFTMAQEINAHATKQ